MTYSTKNELTLHSLTAFMKSSFESKYILPNSEMHVESQKVLQNDKLSTQFFHFVDIKFYKIIKTAGLATRREYLANHNQIHVDECIKTENHR